MRWYWIAFVFILSPSLGLSQQRPGSVHVVRASGEATVSAKPDRAEISIAVVSQAPNAQRASAQNAEQTTQLLNALKRTVGATGDVKTSGYSIRPDYQYSKVGLPLKITGYEAANTVVATINDLTLVGKIIDAAANSGANRINGISFLLRDDEVPRTQALAQAAVKARANAEAIAKALNLQIVGVLEAQSSEVSSITPIGSVAQSVQLTSAVETPIQPGSLDVHVAVTVTLEVR